MRHRSFEHAWISNFEYLPTFWKYWRDKSERKNIKTSCFQIITGTFIILKLREIAASYVHGLLYNPAINHTPSLWFDLSFNRILRSFPSILHFCHFQEKRLNIIIIHNNTHEILSFYEYKTQTQTFKYIKNIV